MQKSVAATVDSVRLAQTQYREGAISFDRVNNLQRELTRLEDQLAVSRTNVALGLIQTYRAVGGGWQIRLGAQPSTTIPAPPEPEDAPEQQPEAVPAPEPA